MTRLLVVALLLGISPVAQAQVVTRVMKIPQSNWERTASAVLTPPVATGPTVHVNGVQRATDFEPHPPVGWVGPVSPSDPATALWARKMLTTPEEEAYFGPYLGPSTGGSGCFIGPMGVVSMTIEMIDNTGDLAWLTAAWDVKITLETKPGYTWTTLTGFLLVTQSNAIIGGLPAPVYSTMIQSFAWGGDSYTWDSGGIMGAPNRVYTAYLTLAGLGYSTWGGFPTPVIWTTPAVIANSLPDAP